MQKIFLTFCTLLLFNTNGDCTHWDFAVTTKSKISFFDSHWNELTSAAHQFDHLSALVLDETENVVYFSDQSHLNGSIFSLRLSADQQQNQNANIIEKVIQRTKNESIAAIAYDPVNRRLYWTDRTQRKIFFAAMDVESTPGVLLDLSNETSIPDGLALDLCRRRLYWTNANFKNATIESINLNGKDRQLLVKTDLYLPHGIIVDQLSDRIYWVVDQQGEYFSVESANLDGSDRQVLVQGLNNIPQHLSVTPDAIFWTDSVHNAVWSHVKVVKPKISTTTTDYDMLNDSSTSVVAGVAQPHKVLSFKDQPYGIVAHTRFLTNLQNDQHCGKIVQEIRERLQQVLPTDSNDLKNILQAEDYCLHRGEQYYTDSNPPRLMCVCHMGWEGARCETNICHNYCVHGQCSMSSMGVPQCDCAAGYQGRRCQAHKCSGYCLNNGICRLSETGQPECDCSDNFGGVRCEHNSTEICALFCHLLKHEPEIELPFGCYDFCSEQPSSMLPSYKHLEVCKNTAISTTIIILVLIAGVALCLLLILLIVHTLRRVYKPARPRIKKTFVVRKEAARTCPDTPLTNRPIATEQCEITIENCCNMNICETPCFDPKLVQQSLSRDALLKEDRKMLIQNMEDDLY